MHSKILILLALVATAVVGESIYDFKVNDIKGNPVNLNDYKGKVTFTLLLYLLLSNQLQQ